MGSFSTVVLIYTIDKSSSDLSTYREREITSFVKVLNAVIVQGDSLKDYATIQHLFNDTVKKLPHIKRLTLHHKDANSTIYRHVVSTIPEIIGKVSDPEDLDAILHNKTTILYEHGNNNDKWIDITYPVTNDKGEAIAALGAAVSLTESDKILAHSIRSMQNNIAYNIIISIFIAVLISIFLSIIVIKKILSPIHLLQKGVQKFSRKEFSPIEINSQDEIGELSKNFNVMAKELSLLYNSMQEQLQSKTKALEIQYLFDELTSLPNRHSLQQDMERIETFQLAILDVAAFKDINDSYGIKIGNRVLKILAHKINFYLNESKLRIYRLGGDEICILNPMHYNSKDFTEKIRQLIRKIEYETIYFEDKDLDIHISLHAGLTLHCDFALEHANIALSQAKKEHIDLSVFDTMQYDAEEKQMKNLDMIKKIKQAVTNSQFIAYYQPILNQEKKIIKYETLVRMKDGDKILSPFFFLDIAKKTKYYKHITRSMITQAFQKFAPGRTSFSVNIEADDIINQESFKFICQQLDNFYEPHRVVFEIVESEDMHNLPNMKEFISFVKAKGAKIAIDDFGTGYSNFSYLLELEPDYLKIDGSLIKNIDKDPKSYNIVKTIVSFAHTLHIKVIAEYIHSKEVLEVCENLNVDEFQGYIFGEPSPKLIN